VFRTTGQEFPDATRSGHDCNEVRHSPSIGSLASDWLGDRSTGRPDADAFGRSDGHGDSGWNAHRDAHGGPDWDAHRDAHRDADAAPRDADAHRDAHRDCDAHGDSDGDSDADAG